VRKRGDSLESRADYRAGEKSRYPEGNIRGGRHCLRASEDQGRSCQVKPPQIRSRDLFKGGRSKKEQPVELRRLRSGAGRIGSGEGTPKAFSEAKLGVGTIYLMHKRPGVKKGNAECLRELELVNRHVTLLGRKRDEGTGGQPKTHRNLLWLDRQ